MAYWINSPFFLTSNPSLPLDGGNLKLEGLNTNTPSVSSSRECTQYLKIHSGSSTNQQEPEHSDLAYAKKVWL
jgi:hypothetical protein